MEQQQKKAGPDPKLEALHRVLLATGKALYSKPETGQSVIAMIRGAESPAQGVVQATMGLLDHVAGQVKGIDPRFVFSAAPAVAAMVAEIGAVAKVSPPDPKFMAEVLPLLAQEVQGRIGQEKGAQPAQQAPAQAEAQPDQQQQQVPPGIVQQTVEA